jgi:hypothetical protein
MNIANGSHVWYGLISSTRGRVCSRDVLQETLLATYKKGASSQRAQIGYLHIESEREARVQKNGTIALPQQTVSPWLAPRTPEHGG